MRERSVKEIILAYWNSFLSQVPTVMMPLMTPLKRRDLWWTKSCEKQMWRKVVRWAVECSQKPTGRRMVQWWWWEEEHLRKTIMTSVAEYHHQNLSSRTNKRNSPGFPKDVLYLNPVDDRSKSRSRWWWWRLPWKQNRGLWSWECVFEWTKKNHWKFDTRQFYQGILQKDSTDTREIICWELEELLLSSWHTLLLFM